MKTSRAVLIAVLAACFPAFVHAIPLCTPGMPVNDYVSLGSGYFLCASDDLFDAQPNQIGQGVTSALAQTATAGGLFADNSTAAVQAFDVSSGPAGTGDAITLHQEMSADSNTGLAAVTEVAKQSSVNFLVPEPASVLLLGWGLLGLARWRKRK